MPLNINKSDRKLLLWAAAIILPIIIALALAPENEEDSGIPSSYSAQTHGAKAAFLLVQELGYKVQRWDDSPEELPEKAEGTVLVLASPLRAPTSEDKAALSTYLSRGGKILATGSSSAAYLPQMELEPEHFPAITPKTYAPQLLTSVTRGGKIEMSPNAYWKAPSTKVLVHYADNDRPIVVSYKHSKGEVIWWAQTAPLTNINLKNSGNMALLLNSLGEPGQVQVYWDEYFHGARGSLSAYIWSTPLSYGLLQALAVFVALLMTYSRRNGPIRRASETPRLSPLEFVHTLGGLYRKARATSAAVEVPYARFRAIATRRLGLPSDVSVDELVRSIQVRFSYKEPGLAELLHRIENTVGRYDLKEADVLDQVQKLNHHMTELRFISQEP